MQLNLPSPPFLSLLHVAPKWRLREVENLYNVSRFQSTFVVLLRTSWVCTSANKFYKQPGNKDVERRQFTSWHSGLNFSPRIILKTFSFALIFPQSTSALNRHSSIEYTGPGEPRCGTQIHISGQASWFRLLRAK